MLALREYFWDDWPAQPEPPAPRPGSSIPTFANPTVFPEIKRRRKVGASLATVLIAAMGQGERLAAGESETALALESQAIAGRKIGQGARAAALQLTVDGAGVATDLELLAALYLAESSR